MLYPQADPYVDPFANIVIDPDVIAIAPKIINVPGLKG